MELLKLHSKGSQVRKWQSFLFGIGYETVEVDGDYGSTTLNATADFQKKHDLNPDGKVGNQTYAAAALLGFPIVSNSEAYPPKPDFAYPSENERHRMLGTFRYTKNGDGSISILDGWAQKNIVKVYIPQLKGVFKAPQDCEVYFHKNGAAQLKALFAAWEAAGVLHYIKSWAGSFNPRMIRGSTTAVSNHAYASAFDINAAWNPLGHTPPLSNKEGTVVPLVEIANAHGFFWGGHYVNRKDGMHFELAVLNRFPKNHLPTLAQTVAAVVEADKVSLHDSNNSAAVVPAVIPPISSSPESKDAPHSGSLAAGETNAKNPDASDDAPPIPKDSKPVDIPQVLAETQPEKEVSGIKASFAGAVTFLTTSGAGLLALFQGVQKELIYGLFGAAAVVGIVFVIGRFWFANKEKERDHTERLEREKRAHEVQLATINTAARKDLNTVNVVPQPIANSDET